MPRIKQLKRLVPGWLKPAHPAFLKTIAALCSTGAIVALLIAEHIKQQPIAYTVLHALGIAGIEIAVVAILFDQLVKWAYEEEERRRATLELEEGRKFTIEELYMVFTLKEIHGVKILEYQEYTTYTTIVEGQEELIERLWMDTAHLLGEGEIENHPFENTRIIDNGETITIEKNGQTKTVKRIEAVRLADKCIGKNPLKEKCPEREPQEEACQTIANGIVCSLKTGVTRTRGEALVKTTRRYLYPYDLTGEWNNTKTPFSRIVQRPTKTVKIAIDNKLLPKNINRQEIEKHVIIYSFNGLPITEYFDIKTETEETGNKQYYTLEIKPKPEERKRFFIMETIKINFPHLEEGENP